MAPMTLRKGPLLAVASLVVISIILLLRMNNNVHNILPFTQVNHEDNHVVFPPSTRSCQAISEAQALTNSRCDGLPFDVLENVQVVLKTGISERERTAAVLRTYGACIPNLLIVSDAPDEVDGHRVYDVLADLPPSYATNNSDWASYIDTQHRLATGESISTSKEGWKLDRFKFLPMVEKAYKLSPDAAWYVFIETDIYYFLDTLLQLLDRFDPNERRYFGSEVAGMDEIWFGYGGAGTVLSGRLVHDLIAASQPSLSAKYRDMVVADCCGDAVLGYVIYKELGIRLENLVPVFNNAQMDEVKVTHENWCMPLLGLHRVNPSEMAELWKWERCRNDGNTAIIYRAFLELLFMDVPHDAATRSNWDNGAKADDKQRGEIAASASECSRWCEGDSNCLQWMYTGGVCYRADFLRKGHSVDRDVRSGWDLKKLSSSPFKECKSLRWPKPRVMAPSS